MKNITLYKKFLIVNILIIVICALGGAWISKQIMHQMIADKKFFPLSTLISNHLIEDENHETKSLTQREAIRSILEAPTFPANIWVFDNQLKIKYSNFNNPLPQISPDHLKTIKDMKELGFREGIVAFKDKNRFLYYKARMTTRIRPHMIWIGTTLISMTLAMSLFAIFIFYHFRKNATMANKVIGELKKGNLNARFPIKKLDELGLVMTSFNSMADEIERLVEELRHADTIRINLLQELAHDLRTPVSSLKTMLETITAKWNDKDEKTEEIKKNFIELSLEEVNYFARLVEDLLFLGRVSEPKYDLKTESISMKSLLERECDLVDTQFPHIQISIKGDDFSILGDSHLLGRLIRNALFNASSYTKDKISISLFNNSIEIIDNGSGFSKEALDNFGEKKFSRIMDINKLSVGLGSVIMKRIVEIHNGKIQVKNSSQSGAIIKIILG